MMPKSRRSHLASKHAGAKARYCGMVAALDAAPAHKPPPVPTCATRVFSSRAAPRAPPFLLSPARSGCSLALCSACTPCSAMAPQRTTAAPAAPATGTTTAVNAGCAREFSLCARQLGAHACAGTLPPRLRWQRSAARGLARLADALYLVLLAARPRALAARAPLRTPDASARGAAAFARCLPTSSSASTSWSRLGRAPWWLALPQRCSWRERCSAGCGDAAPKRQTPRPPLRVTLMCSCRARPRPASWRRSISPGKPSGACIARKASACFALLLCCTHAVLHCRLAQGEFACQALGRACRRGE